MDLMTQIRAAGLRPDVVSYSSLIAALSRGGDWMRVVGVLGSIEEAPDVEANEFVFSAAIAAMERAGEWEKALALFEGLRGAGGLPGDGQASPALFNAAISAAGRGGDTKVATQRTLTLTL